MKERIVKFVVKAGAEMVKLVVVKGLEMVVEEIKGLEKAKEVQKGE